MSRDIVASVIVPLYNKQDTIVACLRSLAAQTIAERLEIIVIDDGSVDESAARAKPLTGHLIRQENAGPAATRNAGARAARGETLLFLDADCVVPPEWAEQTIKALTQSMASAGMMMLANDLAHPLALLTQAEIEERYRLLTRATNIDFIAAAAFAMRRKDFLEIGGFDERFRYNEDVELAYRLNRLGKTIIMVPDVRVIHRHPVSWKTFFLTKFNRGLWRMWLYRLHPGKAVSDSWTPQTLKLQIVGIYGAAGSLLLAPFWPPALWYAIAFLCLFGIAALPLAYSAKRFLAEKLGVTAVLYGFAFVAVRALAQGAAVIAAQLIRSPVTSAGKFYLGARA